MARIVEDSDDEFPDIAQLVKTSRAATTTKGKTVVSRDFGKDLGASVPTLMNGRRGVEKKGKVQDTTSEAREKDEGVEREEFVKENVSRPRKRVLNQKSDNPLLRPLSLTRYTASRASPDFESLGNGVRARAKETKTRIPKETESRASSIRSDEPIQGIRGSRNKDTKILPSKHQKPDLRKSISDEEGDSSDALVKARARKVLANFTSKSGNTSPKERRQQDPILPATKEQRKPASNPKPKPPPQYDSDSEQEDSDNLSDFIVNDSTFLDDGESVMEIPPPKSARRLVQGRRPRKEESEDEDLDLDLKMGRLKLTVGDDDLVTGKDKLRGKVLKDFMDSFGEDHEDDVPVLKLPKKKVPEKSQRELSRPEKTQAQTQQTTGRPMSSGSEIDNPFTLRFSPPPQPRPTTKTTRFTTPPSTPRLSPSKPRGLISPSKSRPKVPEIPHRQSMDAFWAQDVVNDWNDAYSPVKPLSPTKPKPNPLFLPHSPVKKKEMKLAKKTFEAEKHTIAETFLGELDQAITGGKVGELAASTGGIKIVWSNKLNTTAGRANWKRETIRSTIPSSLTSSQPTTTITYRHHASIELASKVISTRPRLLNVLAHEYCHLANFMISNIKTNPHGKEFKIWARKVTSWGQAKGLCKSGDRYGCGGQEEEAEAEVFEVTTKHSYEIEYKYIWQCSACSVLYKRHSKSVDPTRHQCGTCKGRLIQIKPVPRGGTKVSDGKGKGDTEGTASTGTEAAKSLSEYQLFVKDNMKLIRADNPGSPQKEIMGLVGKRYREMKASRLDGNGVAGTIDEINISDRDGGKSKEGTPVNADDEQLSGVIRKLNFLDLSGASP